MNQIYDAPLIIICTAVMGLLRWRSVLRTTVVRCPLFLAGLLFFIAGALLAFAVVLFWMAQSPASNPPERLGALPLSAAVTAAQLGNDGRAVVIDVHVVCGVTSLAHLLRLLTFPTRYGCLCRHSRYSHQ